MRSLYSTLVYLIAFLLAASAHAELFGNWIAAGTSCSADNVSVLASGNSLSILFNQFGVAMPQGQGGDGLQTLKSCFFQISLNAPAGQYLAGFRQVFSGGIIKSRGSSGSLNVNYVVGPAGGEPQSIVWGKGKAILPSDSESNFTQDFREPLAPLFCGSGRAMFYKLNMSLVAARPSANEFFVGGLDSVDAQARQTLTLYPTWEPCPVMTDAQRNITALFRILVRRFTHPGALGFWQQQLPKVGLPGIARQIKASPEYLKGNRIPDPEPIAELYRELLFREPDPQGLKSWVTAAMDGRLSIMQIEKAIKNSPEYRQANN